jgi:hypothetical protein
MDDLEPHAPGKVFDVETNADKIDEILQSMVDETDSEI